MRSIATVLAFVAFTGVCLWAYSSKRRKDFDEAAQLPFNEEDKPNQAREESDV